MWEIHTKFNCLRIRYRKLELKLELKNHKEKELLGFALKTAALADHPLSYLLRGQFTATSYTRARATRALSLGL